MRYIREPTPPNGFATNRSADKSTRPKYPRASCTPDKYNSPATPTGTGRNRESNTNTDEFHTGAPIGTTTPTPSSGPAAVACTVNSVGPYKL
ncbi:hypothetical protein B0E55_06410 [Rhodococcus sp. 66b]|nr:hypothetical protein B0E55_06410 [Rhodococcus sp. 66b]